MNAIAIRIEGGLLSPDFLERIHQMPGQRPADFALDANRPLVDEVSSVYADARVYWDAFQRRLTHAGGESITTVTREQWIIPLLELLGYKLAFQRKAAEADGKSYAISHRVGTDDSGPPVHIVGADQELGSRPPAGRGTMSPHALVQDYLNRTDHLWGIVTNGHTLRLLRDSSYFTRPAYIEFDLRQLMQGEHLDEFILFYRLAHRTRLPRGIADAADCLLEHYHQQAIEQGSRIRDGLRIAVEHAIRIFGNGFLRHPKNEALRHAIHTGQLTARQFYQQLLYLIYRLLFLMVAEERGLLVNRQNQTAADFYRAHLSLARLRALADEPLSAPERFDDLWLGLQTLFHVLHDEKLSAQLALPPLNGMLFDPLRHIDSARLNNRDLLDAIRSLSWFTPAEERVRRRVNYAALDVEELGSVYESLLDLQPVFTGLEAASGEQRMANGGPGQAATPLATRHSPFAISFDFATGTERKSTGSFYTPPELVHELIQSALVPVIEDRLKAAKTTPDRIKSLLSLKVCDPACGSGHFLLAAARRLGRELARLRTGHDEPAPEHIRTAVRDVITHCIYGVDKNPLAVDLCKVALWIESHAEAKPLTFLDHRIRCGDSLVGVLDVGALQDGIPDKAFDPCEGDDKTAARAAARHNREERAGALQTLFALRDSDDAQVLTRHSRELDAIPDDSPELIRRKKELFEAGHRDPAWLRQKQACDLWTAAFFQNLVSSGSRIANGGERTAPNSPLGIHHSPIITTAALADHLDGRPIDARLHAIAASLARRQPFFHWSLEFPEVFASGEWRMASGEDKAASDRSPFATHHSPTDSPGFDVILSNPPWERIKLQEQEFFATRDPRIAAAPNKAARQRLIEQLREQNPSLYAEFTAAVHAADATSKFLRHSGRCPLTGTGDINTYAVFAETIRRLLAPHGRAGVILPTGIATDATCQDFFADLNQRGQLASLFDFENREGLFPAVDSRMKFVLLTLRGALECGGKRAPASATPPSIPAAAKPGAPETKAASRAAPLPPHSTASAEFAFFLTRAEHLRDPRRRFTLSAADLALFNPNTRTCPVFRTRADADLTRAIYQRVPVLLREAAPDGNPWGISFLRMLDMSNDSHLFRTREQLLAEGWRLEGNVFVKPDPGSASPERYLPLYEAKLMHQFDHRFATYEAERMASAEWRVETRETTPEEKADPAFVIQPRYWVAEAEVLARLVCSAGFSPSVRSPGFSPFGDEAEISTLPGPAKAGTTNGRTTNDAPRWLLGFRRITNATNERTFLLAALPLAGAGDNVFLIRLSKQAPPALHLCFLGCLDSIVFDYIARQKIGGTNMNFFIVEQLPVLPPSFYRPADVAYVAARVLELVYTADDMQPLFEAVRMAHGEWPVGPDHSPLATRHSPFEWNEDRRAQLRAELDAWFARAYGLTRKQLRYILDPADLTPRELENILDPWEEVADPLDAAGYAARVAASDFPGETFRVLKEKELAKYGEYRTRRLVLEAWKRLNAS